MVMMTANKVETGRKRKEPPTISIASISMASTPFPLWNWSLKMFRLWRGSCSEKPPTRLWASNWMSYWDPSIWRPWKWKNFWQEQKLWLPYFPFSVHILNRQQITCLASKVCTIELCIRKGRHLNTLGCRFYLDA